MLKTASSLAVGTRITPQTVLNIPAALQFIQSRKENAEDILEQARMSRLDDLRIYFADLQFRPRPAYRHLEGGLQRDIKAFIGW